jgi:hypothetical protein
MVKLVQKLFIFLDQVPIAFDRLVYSRANTNERRLQMVGKTSKTSLL